MPHRCNLNDIIFILLCLFFVHKGLTSMYIDSKYHLVSQSYNQSKNLFTQSVINYDNLKACALNTIDIFLDLVNILNEKMSTALRSAILKFYKLKYFQDFTSYAITMEEMIDITEHCLLDPVDKLRQIKDQFHTLIKNFHDIRRFDTVEKCLKELPDEVAVAQCILHQSVLFNETMQENLIKIVEIKTRQHAQDVNSSMYGVKDCFKHFVPNFYEMLLVDSYTESCGYLKIINASASDLVNDKWRHVNETKFPKKWSPLVGLLKEKSKTLQQEPIFLTLFAANLTSDDIVKTLYSKE